MRRHALPLLLAVLSGAAGLAHQVLWVRRMADVLGADPGTFSRVIASFFLGLALGAFFAARRPTPAPWRSVAWAEGAVAGFALLVLMAGQFMPFLPISPGWERVVHWVLPLVLILPPAFAMGAVIPWLIRAAGPALAVPLYAVNTLGGILGILLVPAWALPTWGLTGASFFAIGLNLAVAAVAAVVAARKDGSSTPLLRGTPLTDLPLALTAFGSGFLVLGTEVILQHQLSQFLISSYLSSALVLALVLTALGCGALLTPFVTGFGKMALPIALGLATLATLLQPLILVIQRGGIQYLSYQQPLGSYLLDALKLGIPGIVLPLLPAALVFPLLLRRATERGVDAGHLLAVNGLGGWLGAEITARIIAPHFGLWQSMTVLAAGYALCLLGQPERRRWVLGAIALLALAMTATWRINLHLPYASLVKGDTLQAVAVGREGVVAVVKGEPDDWRLLVNNLYTLGGSRATTNQERQALLPILLHGNAKSIATLGIATGSTLAGATLDPQVERIEGIELSPLVMAFARDWFRPYNRAVADDPRVTFTLGDARRVIAQRREEFDVIEGDLFLPWNPGEGRLFTREHFANVKAALLPGGIFCQWLPLYQLTESQFETIVRTFREIFPEAWLVRGDFYANMPIVGLVGGIALDEINWNAVQAACERVRIQNDCHDPLLRHVEGVAMCIAGPIPEPGPGPINTLANGWLEWNASGNVIGQREPWFNGVASARYLRTLQQSSTATLPENLRAAQNCGDLSLTLEIAETAELPQAASLREQLRQALPHTLRDDPQAEWNRWPMKFRANLP